MMKNNIKKFNLSKKTKDLINLIVPLCLALPLMIIEMVSMIVGTHLPLYYDWIAFVIATVVIFYFGKEFYKWCFLEIVKYKTVGMSTLVTISTFVSYVYSTYLLIYKTVIFANTGSSPHIMSFYEVGSTIIAIVNAGEYIAGKIRDKSNQDINKLSNLLVPKALLFNKKTNSYTEIETSKLKIGDVVFVKKGTKIPIDGKVIDKPTEVDESLLTGESQSILKNIGDKVIGGSINLSNDFLMDVVSLQTNSILNSIIENVKKIENSKNKTQRIVDVVAKFFTPTIILCAILAFLLQVFVPDILTISNNAGLFGNVNLDWINGDNDTSVKIRKGLYFFIATLTISCPCALGIAAPLASIIGISKGAKNGIIFNNSEVFERIKKINKIVFDKTGTLTTGNLQIVKVIGDVNNLKKIYEMEKISFHPLSKAIVKYCVDNKYNVNNTQETNANFVEIAGVGIFDKTNNEYVCSLNYALKNNYQIHPSIVDEYNKYSEYLKQNKSLQTIVVYLKNNMILNILYLEDEIRKDALFVINKFKKMKIDVAIVTGDNLDNANYIASKLNIKEVYANVSPGQKANIIKQMQEPNNHKNKHNQIAYVGDGINDLGALKQADLSFSITNDNESAKAVADVNLVYLNINSIYKTIVIAKQTRIAIITNLLWAFGYNVITVPLAILGFIPAIVGVYIMMLSDITVNINSLVFKTIKVKDAYKK